MSPLNHLPSALHRVLFCCVVLALVMATHATTEAGLISSASDPDLVGSSVIDFDSTPTGNAVSFTFGDVTFSRTNNDSNAFGGGFLRIAPSTEAGGFDPPGSDQVLSTRDLRTQAFQIDFSNPVSAFGMIWGAANLDWTIDLFDESGVNLETLIAAPSPTTIFVGADGTQISKAVLQTSSGNIDWIVIDDFQFVPAATATVPEPSSLVVFGLSFACIVLCQRPRRT